MGTDPASRPPGRRNNGLGAGSFFSVGDVDPRVGEHLLDVLFVNGIAAYLQPTVDHDAFTRAVSLPGQPTDRLWVDRSRLDDARQLVTAEVDAAGHSQKPPTASSPADDDEAWEQIVATFDLKTASVVPPWPVDEDADEDADSGVTTAQAGEVQAGEVQAAEEDLNAGAAQEDEEAGYVPPPPPPVRRPSKRTALAFVVLAFGLVMIIFPQSIGLSEKAGLTLGILVLSGGIAYLFWNLQDGPSADDRPDDGAVV